MRKNMEQIKLTDEIMERINITTSDCRVLIVVKSDKNLFFCDTVSEAVSVTHDTLTDILISLWTARESKNGYVYTQVPKKENGSVDYDTFIKACNWNKNSVIGDVKPEQNK